MIDGSHVVLVQDHDEESFIAVFDKLTGRELWRKECPEFLRDYATPVIWTVEGRRQVVVLATLRITAYDLESGDEVWTCGGVSRIINMTPVIGEDNTLYAACFSPGNDTDDRVVPLMVKNGGIMTVLDAATGTVQKQKRLRATADYYASSVAGDGKVYLLNVNGDLTVLAADTWDELHTASLDADGHATPAIADGKIFVRAGETLYCFGVTAQGE